MDKYKVIIPTTGANLNLSMQANSETEAISLAVEKCRKLKLNLPQQVNSWVKVYKEAQWQ